jgi:hypothetical protein
MSSPNCSDITKEIILHEILGSSSGGSGSTSLEIDNGILWIWDTSKSKWLSSFRATFLAAESGRVKNKYLPLIDGQVSNLSGYRLARDATLTAIATQTRENETWTLHIRKNGSLSNLASLVISNTSGNHSTAINVDFIENDRIEFFAETTSFFGIKDPSVWIEVAWRNSSLPSP